MVKLKSRKEFFFALAIIGRKLFTILADLFNFYRLIGMKYNK